MGNYQTKPLAVDTESPYVKQILDARQKLTGWERIKLIFDRDEYGRISPELQRLLHTVCISVVVGGLIGAIGRGRIAHQNFLRSHSHEVFESPLQAKRKLQDNVAIGMGSGAFRVGWRLTFFTTIYMSVSTAVSTYRGEMGVLDQVAGAAVAGFIYKLPQGPKAQVAGTLIGSLLGLSAGVITLGLTKITGETIDTANLRYYQYLSKKELEETDQRKQILEKLRKNEKPITGGDKYEFENLTRFHDEMIEALDKKESEHEEQAKLVKDGANLPKEQTTVAATLSQKLESKAQSSATKS